MQPHANCGCGWTYRDKPTRTGVQRVFGAALYHVEDTRHTVDVIAYKQPTSIKTLKPEAKEVRRAS